MSEANAYRRIEVRPIAGAMGAEIRGVDLSRPMSDETFSEIHRAFHEYVAVFFRNQALDRDAFCDFVARFGPLRKSPYSTAYSDHPFVNPMVREANVPQGTRNPGDEWHADHSPEEKPASTLALYCVEAPPYGGDTQYASLYSAYEVLSDGMKRLCERLTVMHSRAGMFGADGRGGNGKRSLVNAGREGRYQHLDEEKLRAFLAETPHPLVCVHPETGRRFLYVTGCYAVRFQGMTAEESKPLLDYLNALAVRPENVCRFRWEKGSLGISDNRCALRYALNDYAGFRREMMRLENEGGPVIGAAGNHRPPDLH